MLDFFRVSHTTTSGACCQISVEPAKREFAITVTMDGLIVNTSDQSAPAFRGATDAEWSDPTFWSMGAEMIAEVHAPRWNPVEAA